MKLFTYFSPTEDVHLFVLLFPKVWGVAYEIPLDEATRKHLDHREAGGYSRQDATFYPTGECSVNDTFKLEKDDKVTLSFLVQKKVNQK